MTTLKQAATKQDELAHLGKFLDTLEEGTYLHSITAGLRDWAREQIADDHGISPVEAYHATIKRHADDTAKLSATHADLLNQIAAMKDDAKATLGLLHRHCETIDRQREENAEVRKLYHDYAGKAHEAQDKVVKLSGEILRLKAKLYDMGEEVTNLRELLGNYQGEEDNQPL